MTVRDAPVASRRLLTRFSSPVLCVALVCAGAPALAGQIATAASLERPAVSCYQGQGVDTNLVNVLPDLFGGDLRFENSRFTALGYYHPITKPRIVQSFFGFFRIPETDTGVELIAAKHYGLQRNGEIDASYLIRLPRLGLAFLDVRLGIGMGLSYALGRPSYEDGPKNDPDKRYRFQYYGSYELDWRLTGIPRVSLVTRIHHRSGIYGIIAPRHVGSNFLALGLRYRL